MKYYETKGTALPEYHIEVNGTHYTYYDKSQWLQRIDYYENGLKVVKREFRSIRFNDGCALIDVTMQGQPEKTYVLRKPNHHTTDNPRYLKKYLALIESEQEQTK